jgi:hypothetical protein
MQRSKAEGFTAYLEEKQRLRAQASPAVAQAAGVSPMSLLTVLACVPAKSMLIPELHKASRMGFNDFADSIKKLQDSAYITIGGDSGKEAVQLTQLGSDVAELARTR